MKNSIKIILVGLSICACGLLVASNGCPLSKDKDTTSGSSGLPPNAPSRLIANSVSPFQIDLSWQDNSNYENGFKIERRTDSVSYTHIATVTGNTITYSDIGLVSGKTYYYRIRAYNTNGNSFYSNETSATTSSALQVTSPEPADGITGVLIAHLLLSWTAASAATSYDVYFGITTTAWTPVTNTALTSFSPSGVRLLCI